MSRQIAGRNGLGEVQSLSRAFSLLEAIAETPEGVGLTQLSRITGLHSSTAFHLLKTMVGLGYIRQGEENKRYFIGSALFCLASAAQNEVQLVTAANRVLRELSMKTGIQTLFGLRAGTQMVVVAKADGNGAFQISDGIGGMRPAHCTGMGKIMLASMSEQELEVYLASYELKAFTGNTITEKTGLLRELAEVRRSGLAFDDAEFHPELRCMAACVRDLSGNVIGALAMSGPSWRLSLQALQATSGTLREAADTLSGERGYRKAQPPAHPAKTNGAGDSRTRKPSALKGDIRQRKPHVKHKYA
jgi:IclR family KDG regulon transcriptional repressor